MDIGKFKASRTRLLLWIVLPPLIFIGVGLSAYALRLQAEWELNRTRLLSSVLPKLVHTQRAANDLLAGFQGSDAFSIQSEDDLIAYIKEIERGSKFTVDSLQVEREPAGKNMSVLSASVVGEGTFGSIESFLSDVVTGQHLLYGSKVQLTKGRGTGSLQTDMHKADITLKLILLNSLKPTDGGGK